MQRNVHSSTIDGLIVSGLRPTFVAPEIDPELGIAHCVTPEALDRALAGSPGAVGAMVVSPTYFGAVADVRGLAGVAHRHGVPLVVDEAWGAHLAFGPSLPRACARLRRRPRRLEHPQDHRQLHPVGDAPPRAAAGGSTSTSWTARSPCWSRPARARCCAARSTRRGRSRPRAARALLEETMRALAGRAAGDRRASRASTCSTSVSPSGRACTPTTRCGSSSTCGARA